MSNPPESIDARLGSLLSQRAARSQLRRLTTVPPGMADFSSNSYLSLSSHPVVQQNFLEALKSHIQAPTSPPLLGATGSRLLDGNSPLAESLETTLADFHRAPAALLFNSAMDANVGLFGCVPQAGDAIVYDELIHASVHDGMRASRVPAGARVAFAHNSVWEGEGESEALPPPLEVVLKKLVRTVSGCVFVACEGVYSMDGDEGRIREVVECVERCLPAGKGLVVVDEAHSTGIFGDKGGGLVCELGLEDRVWARVHGFGKAMGCAGGVVLCSSTTRAYLANYARTLIYTTFMAPHSLLAIKVTYDFLAAGHATPLLAHLSSVSRLAHTRLADIARRLRPPAELFTVGEEAVRAPIIPVLTSEPRALAAYCQEKGYMVRPIVAPTVPRGKERVRVCLHAGNTVREVEGLVAAMEEWVVGRMRITEESRIGVKEGPGQAVVKSRI